MFMDLDNMRTLLGEEDDYYNVVFSEKALNIPAGRLYSTVTRADIIKSSGVFTEMMAPMVIMFTVVSIFIFAVVLYLMMKVMVDRSSFHISLFRVFGYRMKEIRKLYLNGNFYIVAIGTLLCIPLSKWMMNEMYPVLVSNVACGIDVKAEGWMYAVIYLTVLILYFIINTLLVGKIKKILPAEVLKNRE